MKKVLLGFAIILTFSVTTCFAAPLNTLQPGETAAGLVYWGAVDRNDIKTITDSDFLMGGAYVERKLSNQLTIGLEGIGRTDTNEYTYYGIPYYTEETTTTLLDLYLHYHINDNVRLVVGDKFFNHNYSDSDGASNDWSDNKAYVGAAVSVPLSKNLETYAAWTTADLQVGANVNFPNSYSMNIFYRTAKFSLSDAYATANLDFSGIGFGISSKF